MNKCGKMLLSSDDTSIAKSLVALGISYNDTNASLQYKGYIDFMY